MRAKSTLSITVSSSRWGLQWSAHFINPRTNSEEDSNVQWDNRWEKGQSNLKIETTWLHSAKRIPKRKYYPMWFLFIRFFCVHLCYHFRCKFLFLVDISIFPKCADFSQRLLDCSITNSTAQNESLVKSWQHNKNSINHHSISTTNEGTCWLQWRFELRFQQFAWYSINRFRGAGLFEEWLQRGFHLSKHSWFKRELQ